MEFGKVKAVLKIEIETELTDKEADAETVRYLVEQDLEDMGYTVNDVSVIEKSKDMKEYAIWKNHKVIGHVYLTKEQENVLNSTKGIDLYFGFDEKTNPEKYRD